MYIKIGWFNLTFGRNTRHNGTVIEVIISVARRPYLALGFLTAMDTGTAAKLVVTTM